MYGPKQLNYNHGKYLINTAHLVPILGLVGLILPQKFGFQERAKKQRK